MTCGFFNCLCFCCFVDRLGTRLEFHINIISAYAFNTGRIAARVRSLNGFGRHKKSLDMRPKKTPLSDYVIFSDTPQRVSADRRHQHLSTSPEMALIDPLLKTTGSPIWVHPLLWGLDHLDKFGISVRHINSPTADPLSQSQTTTSAEGRLRGGSIGPRDLKYILQDVELLEIHLAGFLVRTINTFQKSSRPKPFRFFSQEQALQFFSRILTN